MGFWAKGKEGQLWKFESKPLDREKAREEAMSFLRADYYTDVRELGEELIERVENGEITDAEGFDRAMHEAIDGDRRVFITHLAKLGLMASYNEDAYHDETGEESDTPEQAMYWAMRQDLGEWLSANDFDPNDDDTWSDDDDEDEDEEDDDE